MVFEIKGIFHFDSIFQPDSLTRAMSVIPLQGMVLLHILLTTYHWLSGQPWLVPESEYVTICNELPDIPQCLYNEPPLEVYDRPLKELACTTTKTNTFSYRINSELSDLSTIFKFMYS